MIATVPAHDDLRECRAKDTLARSGGCSEMQPGALQIQHRAPSIAGAPARRAAATTMRNQGGDLSFDPCDSLRAMPRLQRQLQLAGDQDGLPGRRRRTVGAHAQLRNAPAAATGPAGARPRSSCSIAPRSL